MADIWAPILADSVDKANLESVGDVKTLLELHEASVEDYLCASFLRRVSSRCNLLRWLMLTR